MATISRSAHTWNERTPGDPSTTRKCSFQLSRKTARTGRLRGTVSHARKISRRRFMTPLWESIQNPRKTVRHAERIWNGPTQRTWRTLRRPESDGPGRIGGRPTSSYARLAKKSIVGTNLRGQRSRQHDGGDSYQRGLIALAERVPLVRHV